MFDDHLMNLDEASEVGFKAKASVRKCRKCRKCRICRDPRRSSVGRVALVAAAPVARRAWTRPCASRVAIFAAPLATRTSAASRLRVWTSYRLRRRLVSCASQKVRHIVNWLPSEGGARQPCVAHSAVARRLGLGAPPCAARHLRCHASRPRARRSNGAV